jgi:hypothetical protein
VHVTTLPDCDDITRFDGTGTESGSRKIYSGCDQPKDTLSDPVTNKIDQDARKKHT